MSGILISGNPRKNQEKLISMRNVQKTLALSLCVILMAQEETKTKKRKVYRTQSGAIIEAPRPLFERSDKKEKVVHKKKSVSTARGRRSKTKRE